MKLAITFEVYHALYGEGNHRDVWVKFQPISIIWRGSLCPVVGQTSWDDNDDDYNIISSYRTRNPWLKIRN